MAPLLRPALLLMDIHLPDCMGSELLPLLRLRFGWRDVPAVAVTAEPDFKAHRESFIEVWRKPLDQPLVLKRLDQWLPPPALITAARAATGTHALQRVTRQLR
jgi:CheY-like chemotaxis protein